ncbi:MAG TPA: DNA-deoxyinosine glycosylase, partial [Gammaproteobacteria bacterium]|nr:DNA-deoxyinosine glycosylase [Gammaproteobacteria bacterium]
MVSEVRKSSFPPLVGPRPQVLVLGSIPGEEALRKQQYYGNPQNAFWSIMAQLFGFSTDLDYQDKVASLTAHPIAVWDVIGSCIRPGSLDSSIDGASVEPNELIEFLREHTTIHSVFFNGSRAQQEFRRHVQPGLGSLDRRISMTRLPSTSPAMARLRPADKLEQWRVVRQAVT